MDAVARTSAIDVSRSLFGGSMVALLYVSSVWFVSKWTYNNIEMPGQKRGGMLVLRGRRRSAVPSPVT
jgi:hypothetical protein